MKAAIVTSCLTRNAGGILDSLRGLTADLSAGGGLSLDVLGLEETGTDQVRWQGVSPRTFPTVGPGQFGYSPGLRRALAEGGYDVVHQHALWMYPSVAVSGWHKETGRPYVISPHGMLDPWALANSGWKKRIASAVFEKRNLQGAACLHALCASEAESIRALGLRNPIAVVPNGVALPAQRGDGWRVQQCFGNSVGRCFGGKPKTLLFLGRLHPKKGLPEALRAWAEATKGKQTGWRFVIAGWDQGGHEAELREMCGELGVRYAEDGSEGGRQVAGEDGWKGGKVGRWESAGAEVRDRRSEGTVVFAGPAFGEAKEALLRTADAFILPSLSEGLPMSVLEAWAYELPVLMTDECNLPEGFAAQAAIRISGARHADQKTKGPTDQEIAEGGKVSVAEGMLRLMEMTDADRRAMGAKGRALVEERFTWPRVAHQMKQVYDWLCGKGTRPGFVREC